ncbi:hypothetical protein ACFL41_01770 [Gemmatimonadota bacterium]
MYSTRITTVHHGTAQFFLLPSVMMLTAILAVLRSPDYLVIYLSSGILVGILEIGLSLTGWRTSRVTVFGKELAAVPGGAMRGFIEAPGIAVPAFFMADLLVAGQHALAIAVPTILIGIFALYSSITDWSQLKRLKEGEQPIHIRRKMTRPAVVMVVAVVDVICLSSLFMMPDPYRTHGFFFLLASFALTALFFGINYSFGVRIIQQYNYETNKYYKSGTLFSVAAFIYDSFYEMSLFNMYYYLIPYMAGLFTYSTIS